MHITENDSKELKLILVRIFCKLAVSTARHDASQYSHPVMSDVIDHAQYMLVLLLRMRTTLLSTSMAARLLAASS